MSQPLAPYQYPRRILLAVAANTPQIVTETIYALAQQENPWIPTELHVITTGRGVRNIQDALGAGQNNWLKKLCVDYQLPPITLADNNIHIISNSQNEPLADIRNSADNVCAADYITHWVRMFTADPQSCLYASLSDGRRTMTYYMGYALSLFGRAQDRLTHVLIEDEYFFNEQFYYPPPYSNIIQYDNGKTVDAAKIEVTLADIPFIRLRAGLPTDLLQGSTSFSDTIHAAQQRFTPLNLCLDYHQASLHCSGIPIKMPPADLSFYAWLISRHLNQQAPVHWRNDEQPSLVAQYLQHYTHLYRTNGNYQRLRNTLSNGMSREWFDERKSKTNTALCQALGKTAAQPYLLQTQGTRPYTTCCLSLPLHTLHRYHPPDDLTSLSN